MKQYRFFNFICGFLIFLAILGTGYFARGYVKQWFVAKQNADIPVAVSRTEIEKRVQTSTAAVQVFSTSSQKVTVTSSKFLASSTIQTPIAVSSTSVSIPVALEIPDSINLAVPFVPQAPEKNWDQPWQDACEEAAILMMDAYEQDRSMSIDSAKHDILAMVKWEEDLGWGRSIEIKKIQKIFAEYLTGYTSSNLHIIKNPTVDQIKQYIASGHPVLVVANGKTLPNPHFQNGGPPYHALVIRGYTKDSFITNDPGTQFGQNYKYKYQDLMNAIHDWNDGDVSNGQPVVLLID